MVSYHIDKISVSAPILAMGMIRGRGHRHRAHFLRSHMVEVEGEWVSKLRSGGPILGYGRLADRPICRRRLNIEHTAFITEK
jgi:hypothetical protein